MISTKQKAGILGGYKTKLLHEKLNAEKRLSYSKNPSVCKNCGIKHKYEQRNNKFCSKSCAVVFNNTARQKNRYNCINCTQLILGKSKKYCSIRCQHEKQTKEKIETGDVKHAAVKNFLLKIHGEKCWACGIVDWQGKKLTFELEHIDGNSENNKIENLSILCPNCHSQTSTYKAKNKGKGRYTRRLRYLEGKSY